MDIAPRPVDPMGVPARTSVELRDHDHRTTIALCPPNHHSTEEGLRRRTRVASISPPGTPERFEVGFGGFPGPEELITRMSRKLLPGLHRNLRQTFTMPRTATLVPQDGGSHEVDATGQITRVPYLSFIADVKRNSRFHDLTEEQLLELGGVEYRALNTLLWVVPLWFSWRLVILADKESYSVVSFVGDLVLNINNPATDAIPVGTRIALAFLSAAAVRNAGFQGIAVSSLTPATQVLYVIMMYISIYPIALSVRATNVYEENSLGIYRPDAREEDHQHMPDATEKRVAIWGIYLMRHARKQLSFETQIGNQRDGLEDPEKPWFSVFALSK
ncbi:hypothetical protein PHLCEN_2v1871 [Hermanssonia centrifuga]|uniref:Uncharacterized protein n=1 Tax=Hermanssonia centrifuga TaxID=98765 RepID=A0A2R6RVM1_9APHY|nr:hypothetical protein PHLCEN_2v1871 [Hermanssonia centrifuga]